MSRSRILILILSVGAFGCTKATPTFELSDEGAIPQPKFSGSTTKTIKVNSPHSTFTVSGECDHKIRTIKGMLVSVTASYGAVSDLTVTAPSVNCSSTGTFSFQFKSLTDLGFSPIQEGRTYEIQLKGSTSAGMSRASKILITYDTGSGNKNIWIAGGGVPGSADSASFATMPIANTSLGGAEVYMMHTARDPSGSPSNANFKLRVGADAR